MSHENVNFIIPTNQGEELKQEAIRLQASIARGDRHLYIVASNNGKDVEVIHLGQLLGSGIETGITAFDAPPDFTQNYPTGSLVWLTMRSDDWECAPVTTMDSVAKANYERAKEMLFGKRRETKVGSISNFIPKGKNPREQ